MKITEQQNQIIQSQSRFKVVAAGRRWGKTYLALIEGIMKAVSNPSTLIWYVSPTYRQSKNIAWQLLKNMFYENNLQRWLKKKPNESEMSITLLNGSEIHLKGSDNEDSLRGVGLNHLILDEFQHIKKTAWTEVLRPTLTDKLGTATFIGTPDGFGYFYELWEMGNRRENNFMSWKYRTIESPFIDSAEIEAARNELDERTFRQEYEASFEQMEGLVYYAFSREHNVIDSYEVDNKIPIILTVDFNVNPMCWAVGQVKNNQVYYFDEIVLRNANSEIAAREFRRRYPKERVYIYGDYSGNQRSTNSPTTDYNILNSIIKPIDLLIEPNPRVIDRINAVNSMLCSATGRRRLFVLSSCKHIIKDFEQVQYREGKREIDKSNPDITHISDAIGYHINYEFPILSKADVTIKKF